MVPVASAIASGVTSRRASPMRGSALLEASPAPARADDGAGLNVLMISPGYPEEMVHFTRGLAGVGAQVIGVGDQPQAALDPLARRSLADYLQVESLWDEAALVEELRRRLRGARIDRVECLWEPGMLLAAGLRESLGVPGMSREQTVPFRDKERMKQALDSAGIRTPRHYRAATSA